MVVWSEIGESFPVSEKSSVGANGLQPAIIIITKIGRYFLIKHSF